MLIGRLIVHGLQEEPFHNMRCQNGELNASGNHANDAHHAFLDALRADVTLPHCGSSLHLELPGVHLDEPAFFF